MSIPFWITVQLENVVLDTQPGFAQRPNQGNIGVPQLRTNNITREGQLDLSGISYVDADDSMLQKYGVLRGDIIFNNTNSPELVGKTAFFDLDTTWVISNHMTRIRVDPDLADAEYLSRYLHYLWQTGATKSWAKQWVNQAAIDQESLKKFKIVLPLPLEQRRIAAILRQADMIRQWQQETIKKHDQLLFSLFYDLFGNPLDETNNLGFKRVREMGTVITGNTPPRERKEFYGDFIEWIKTDNISNEQVFVSKSQEGLSEMGMSVGRTVLPGSVLIACIAGSLESIGRVALTDRKVAFNQQINAITPFNDINPYYLYAVIKLSRSRIQAYSKKALKEIVSKSTLEEVLLLCPPKNLQDEFAKRFLELNKIKGFSLRSKEGLSKLFLSLSNRAFSGRLTASWREKHKEELQRAAVERDKKLGVRGEVPTYKDIEEGRLTPEEEEQIRQVLSQALGQFAVNVTKLLEPMGLSTIEASSPLFDMSKNIFEPIIQSLRQSLQEAVSVQRPLIPPINSERVLRYIDNLPVPQEKRAIIETLDTTTIRVLKLAGTYPAYFTADDLEAGEYGGITTLQAETSLRTLQALGFVKLVQIDGLLRYRLTDENDFANLPSSLSLQQ